MSSNQPQITPQVLALDGNQLGGSLPPRFPPLAVKFLFLDSNSLQGTIPPSFGDARGLTWLTLSGNNFT